MNIQLVETWNIHHRIVMHLFDQITDDGLEGVPLGMPGARSVSRIFVHLHNVRLMWLENSAPELITTTEKIKLKTKADREAVTRDRIRSSLDASAQAIAALWQKGIEEGKIKDCKPHVTGCFGYFMAHEWYHLGEVCMTLTQAGHPLDDKILYGIWEWAKFAPKG